MPYSDTGEALGQDFTERPLDYVAEADFQASLIERLRSQISPPTAKAEDASFEGASDTSFKREYSQIVAQQLTDPGEIARVHAEVSVRQGERLDVGVFRPSISGVVQWVSSGSKRFDADDLEAIFELKFVKNKTSFPTVTGQRVSELAEDPPTVEDLLERANTDDPILDLEENKLRSDIRELNRLSEVDSRILLLFSNNNYLYHDSTATEDEEYRYGELYRRLGEAAREWIAAEADEGVAVLYGHPFGWLWLTS